MAKMTKRDYFATIEAIIVEANPENVEEILGFIHHEVELLNKKSSRTGQTKTQKENVEIMAVITDVLAEIGKPVTITEMQQDARLAGYSNQKLSALVRQMPNVEKTVDKKKSYFSIKEN